MIKVIIKREKFHLGEQKSVNKTLIITYILSLIKFD